MPRGCPAPFSRFSWSPGVRRTAQLELVLQQSPGYQTWGNLGEWVGDLFPLSSFLITQKPPLPLCLLRKQLLMVVMTSQVF